MEHLPSDIVVIGSLNMDLVVTTARMPGAGETLHGETFAMIPGGKGANQAVAAARLGGQVAMVGRLGRDSFADGLRQNLAVHQIDTRHLQTDPTASTGVALIVVEAAGKNRILVVGGANQAVLPQDVFAAEPLLGKAKLLLVQFEVPMPAVEAVLRKVRFANAAGAVATTRLGAQSSLPKRSEVEALLANNALEKRFAE